MISCCLFKNNLFLSMMGHGIGTLLYYIQSLLPPFSFLYLLGTEWLPKQRNKSLDLNTPCCYCVVSPELNHCFACWSNFVSLFSQKSIFDLRSFLCPSLYLCCNMPFTHTFNGIHYILNTIGHNFLFSNNFSPRKIM